MWLFTRFVRPCIIMLKNARSVILHEMINYLLCMILDPINAEQSWLLVKTITWVNYMVTG